ncbi:MAG: 50S ribosomal protein L11 methyltransferase [Alphaproteobacteria bacterium]
MTGISGWTLVVEVPKEAVDIFDQAFSLIAVATSSFETSDQSIWRMEAFCVDRPDEMAVVGAVALAAEIAGIPEPTVHASALPDIDWVSENQKSFQPIIAGGFFVHPTHYDGEVPATVTTLAIDAGPAFGTGSHGSTKGCLLALDWLSRRPPVGDILDLGCGSGILAIAMARRWGRKVLAADIDPDSVATTRGNAVLNNASDLVRSVRCSGVKSGAVKRNGPYGLIVANILARPIIDMAQDIKGILRPGGTLILAGFTESQENSVRAVYQRRDYHLARKEGLDGWTTFVLTRFGGKR